MKTRYHIFYFGPLMEVTLYGFAGFDTMEEAKAKLTAIITEERNDRHFFILPVYSKD